MAAPCSFEELSSSCRTHWNVEQGASDVRRFKTAWSDRWTFANYLAGVEHPSLSECYVKDITIEPLSPEMVPTAQVADPAVNLPTFDHALIVCTYNYDPAQAAADWPCDIAKPSHTAGTDLKLRARISGQFLTMAPQGTRFSDNPSGYSGGAIPQADSQATRLLIPVTEYHVAWLYLSEPPITTWRETLLGHTNSASFLGCEAETLLFDGFELEEGTKPDSLTDPFCWNLNAVLRSRRINDNGTIVGWNHEHREDGWKRVQMKDSGGSLVNRYPTTSFADMFTENTCSSSSSSSGA